EPKYVVDNEVARLRTNGFDIEEVINLQPFDKDHAIAFARYN
ncbi:MAG: fibrillarin-like rRNA/tRNA 2'-O-methyltransferase, partial [Nitrososphaerales archaeon]